MTDEQAGADSFVQANDEFHSVYDRARARTAEEVPLFVVLEDSLLVLRGNVRREMHVTPPEFHQVKSISHVGVAAITVLARMAQTGATDEGLARLARIAEHATLLVEALDRNADVNACVGADALASLPDGAPAVAKAADDAAGVLPANVASDARAVLVATLALIAAAASACKEGSESPPAPASEHPASELGNRSAAARASAERIERVLAIHARDLGTVLLRLTEFASRIQLDALHRCVEDALRDFSPTERASLQVVVAGAHQARDRSLGMQYFRTRFDEAAGLEDRVVYGEGVTDEHEARTLVGTRRLDRSVAALLFGDARRLQRDVLGDATAALLAGAALTPIR